MSKISSTPGRHLVLEYLISRLDEAYELIQKNDFTGIGVLINELTFIRNKLNSENAMNEASHLVRNHGIFLRLLEDHYTHHAFIKPRGFAGDASLIDLFYGHRSGIEAITDVGRSIFDALMRLPSCDAVRYRRGYYGAFIDRASERPQSQILALACGHLREALFSRAVTDRAVRLIGIDSDPLAVAEARRSLGSREVEIRNASVIDFVRRRAWGEKYDAIYAAGLFDYLDVRIGMKTIATAYEALRPGGVLSIANFLPSIVERGYMDLVMDWRLIYRNPDDMIQLASHLPVEISNVNTWVDPFNSIVYLTVTKARH